MIVYVTADGASEGEEGEEGGEEGGLFDQLMLVDLKDRVKRVNKK